MKVSPAPVVSTTSARTPGHAALARAVDHASAVGAEGHDDGAAHARGRAGSAASSCSLTTSTSTRSRSESGRSRAGAALSTTVTPASRAARAACSHRRQRRSPAGRPARAPSVTAARSSGGELVERAVGGRVDDDRVLAVGLDHHPGGAAGPGHSAHGAHVDAGLARGLRAARRRPRRPRPRRPTPSGAGAGAATAWLRPLPPGTPVAGRTPAPSPPRRGRRRGRSTTSRLALPTTMTSWLIAGHQRGGAGGERR